MDGITVLYEYALREWWAVFMIVIGSITGIAALSMAIIFRDDINTMVPSSLGVLLCLVLVTFSWTYDGRYYCQKVLIDDSVNLVEFNKHYEIMSQQGKIYTVKLIEQKEDE